MTAGSGNFAIQNHLIAPGAIAVTEGVSVALLRMGVATAPRSVSGGTVIVKELALVLNPTFPDRSRTGPSGRGFFTFGHHALPYAKTASESPATECAGCHQAHVTNTDMTWVQFYPLLLEKE
jgi:hypothetical protein